MSDLPESDSNWTSFPALPEEVEEPVGLAEKLLGFFTAAVAPGPAVRDQTGGNSKANSIRAGSTRGQEEQLTEVEHLVEDRDERSESDGRKVMPGV